MDDRVTLDNLSRDLQEARHVRECCISFCKLLQAHKQQQESSWEDFLASKIRFLDMYYLLLDGKALLNLWSDAFKEKADVVMLFFRCYRCLCNFLADEVKMTFTFDEIIARFLQALFIFLEEHDKDEYFILLSNFVQYWDTNLQMHLLPLLVNRNVLANRFVQFADPEWSLSALCLLLKNTTKSTPNIQLCIALANRALTELDATLVTEQSILRFALPKDLSAAILQTIGLNNFPKLLASVLLVLSDRNAISHKSTTLIESLANVAIQTLSQLDRNSLSAALPDLSTSLEVMITLAVSSSLDSSNKLVRICGMKIGKAYANKCGYDLQFDEIPTEEPLDANIDFNTPVLDPSSTSTAAHSDSDSDSDSELEGYGIQDNAIFADLKSIPEIQTNYLSVCLQLLNCPENDSHAKEKQVAGLRRIPIIMEKNPADAGDYCTMLVESIFNLSNMYSIEDFDQLRSQAVIAVSLKFPTKCLEVMQKCLYSRDVGLGLKLFCLSILQKLAQQLSMQATSMVANQPEEGTRIPSKTIIKHPKKLEQLKSQRATYRNNFLPICDACFQTVKTCLAQESMPNIGPKIEEYNLIKDLAVNSYMNNTPKDKKEASNDFDLMLTTNCIVTLTVFLTNMQHSYQYIGKYAPLLIEICRPHIKSTSVELRKTALLGCYFSIEMMLTQFKSAHGNNTRDYTALGLLQNISSLQVMDLDDCAREETTEVLANPAMVDYLEAVIEMYSQENDEICREIIAKTVNLYKKHL